MVSIDLEGRMTYLFNDVGTELLNRKRANVASELTNNTIAETAVVQVEDILNNLLISEYPCIF